MSSAQSPEFVVSVVLLPNQVQSLRLEKLSAAINEQVPSAILLGRDSLPHITVAQFAAPVSVAEDLWLALRQLPASVSELTAAGLTFLPSRKKAETWIEVAFLKSQALNDLQAAILRLPVAAHHPLLNGAADMFRPHCSVALIKGRTIPALELSSMAQQALRDHYGQLKLAVGLNTGGTFTLSRILFE